MKASKILMTIGGVICLIFTITGLFGTLAASAILGLVGTGYTGVGIGALVVAYVPDAQAMFIDFMVNTLGQAAAEVDALISELMPIGISFTFSGLGMLAGAVTALVSGLISFIVTLITSILGLGANGKKRGKGRYIAVIIFAAISLFFFVGDGLMKVGVILLIVGSIIGLTKLGKEKEPEVITVK